MCTKHMMFLHDFCFNEIDSRRAASSSIRGDGWICPGVANSCFRGCLRLFARAAPAASRLLGSAAAAIRLRHA